MLFVVPGMLGAQDLGVGVNDLRIEQTIEGGYYLYVRNKPDIGSIMLTETTEDPDRKLASYALRDPEYHPENGDEIRMLNGEVLDNSNLHSLIDSTPVRDAQFGEAFKIFIPWVVVWGNPENRHGETQVLDGTYLSVRAFELPYGDYRGSWQDNPFVVRVTQKPSPRPPAPVQTAAETPDETVPEEIPDNKYRPETVETFSRIAETTKGKVLYSDGQEDILNQLDDILSDEEGDRLDLVLALDSTESMTDDMPWLREHLTQIIKDNTAGFEQVRIGFVYYRDYLEEYLYRISPFETGLDRVQNVLDHIRPAGGRDIPEAVNEALYAALTKFDWRADNRKIILIGDAPPHPRPRGNVTEQMVEDEARNLAVAVHVIILPH